MDFEDQLNEDLANGRGLDLEHDVDDAGNVVTAAAQTDRIIADLFPEAAEEIARLDEAGRQPGLVGSITREMRYAEKERDNALDALVDQIGRIRYRLPQDLQDANEEALQKRWKDHNTYHESPQRKWTRFVEFKVSEYSSIDWDWLNSVAMNHEAGLADRLSLIVCYLNNFWASIGTGRNSGILNKARSTLRNRGSPMLAETRACEFESFLCNRSISFATSDRYSALEKAEILRLFNGGNARGAVGPTALPDCSKKVKFDADTGLPVHSGSKTYAVNVFKLWRFHHLRRSVSDIIFDPTPEDQWAHGYHLTRRTVINLWRPFAMTQEAVHDMSYRFEDELKVILDHIYKYVCNGAQDEYDQFIYTLAFWLQRPWVKFESIPILRGEQGVGKSAVLDMYMKIIGDEMCYKTTKLDDAMGDKTDNLEGIYILYLNEAYNPQKKEHDSVFKALITEPAFRLRKFYQPPKMVPKFFRTMADTNHPDVINAEGKDRRYQLYECNSNVPSRAYFKRFFLAAYGQDMAGVKAFADFLYSHDLTNGDKTFESGREPIVTRLLVQQQMSSMDARKRLFLEILQQGSVLETSRCFDREDEWLKNQRMMTGYQLALNHRNRCREELQTLARNWTDPTTPVEQSEEFKRISTEKDYWTDESIASEKWETVVPMDKLIRVYRRLAQEQNNRKAMEMGIVDTAKLIFGQENVRYFSRPVHLIATEKDLRSGVELKKRTEEEQMALDQAIKAGRPEHGPQFRLLDKQVQRNYLQIPMLVRARQLFSDFMGWNKATFDPFEKDSAELARQDAHEFWKEPFDLPDNALAHNDPAATIHNHRYKKRPFTSAFYEPPPLDTQQDALLYASPVKRARAEPSSPEQADEPESEPFVLVPPSI